MPVTKVSSARRRACAAAVAALTGLLLVGGLPAQASTAHPRDRGGYVALGDSYASGEGLAPYEDGAGTCDRSSTQSYPARLQQSRLREFDRLTSLACSGAGTAALVATQVPAVDARTRTITLTVGGNDLGLSRTLGACLFSPVPAVQQTLPGGPGCQARLDAPISAEIAFLGGPAVNAGSTVSVAAVVAAVAAQAPDATILVSAYPQLFGPAEAACQVTPSAPIFIAASDVNWIRAKTAALDEAIRAGVQQARADGADASYVDPRPYFRGHGVCDTKTPWINGLVLDPTSTAPVALPASFHPTAVGQIAYAASFVFGCRRWR